MAPETLFGQAGLIAMLGWGLLILGPRRFAWVNAVPALVLPAVLSALYAVLVLTSFAGAEGGFGSLAEVRALFADDWVLLAGWVHYLAFDLMIGAVLAGRMDRVGVGRLVQAPVLVLVFLLGPLGALLALLTEGTLRLRPLAPRLARRSGPLSQGAQA
jgi:hypothetical protein